MVQAVFSHAVLSGEIPFAAEALVIFGAHRICHRNTAMGTAVAIHVAKW